MSLLRWTGSSIVLRRSSRAAALPVRATPAIPSRLQNILGWHRILSQAFIYLKHAKAIAVLTIHELKRMVRPGGDRARSVMQRMYPYSANIAASLPYWYARQQELQAILSTKDYGTLFVHPVRCAQSFRVFSSSQASPIRRLRGREASFPRSTIPTWLIRTLASGWTFSPAPSLTTSSTLSGSGSGTSTKADGAHIPIAVEVTNDPDLIELTAKAYGGVRAKAAGGRRDTWVRSG